MKIKDMPKCDRPIEDWGNQAAGDFAPTEGRGNKPKRPKISSSNQIQEIRPKQTQASYLPYNLSVRAKISAFFSQFECERSIKDARPDNPLETPPILD